VGFEAGFESLHVCSSNCLHFLKQILWHKGLKLTNTQPTDFMKEFTILAKICAG